MDNELIKNDNEINNIFDNIKKGLYFSKMQLL